MVVDLQNIREGDIMKYYTWSIDWCSSKLQLQATFRNTIKQKVDLRQLYNPVGGYGNDKTKVLKLDENLTKYTEQIPIIWVKKQSPWM